MSTPHAAVDPVRAHLRWMQERGVRPITIKHRRNLLRRIEEAVEKPLLEVDRHDLAAWRSSLEVGQSSAIAYIGGVRNFYAWALREELIVRDPSTRLPCPRQVKRLPKPIPEDELARALLLAPRRIRPWLVLAAYAGLRAQEIALLLVDDLKLEGDSPYLSVSSDAAKGGRPRIVPISDRVRRELLQARLPGTGYAFRRQDGKAGPNTPHLVSLLSNNYLHALGMPYSIHTLRHRFGTRMYAVSLDLRMTQEVMGHASPSTTAGYVAYNAQSAIAAVDAI